MLTGSATKLESRFRLTYGMLLNLLRVEELRVEDMMKRSFSEFNGQKDQESFKKELKDLRQQVGNSLMYHLVLLLVRVR